MSLFEWLWEAQNPQPVGNVKRQKPEEQPPNPNDLLWGVLGTGLLVVVLYAVLAQDLLAGYWESAAWNAAALAIYLIMGYWLRVNPRYDNLGWWGGVLDNPFRFSDDLNRFLVLFKLVLWPARFMVSGVLILVRSLRN
jgi:hypothetical protein